MKMYLVRHCETSWNAIGKLQGHRDITLNEVGVLQARLLGDRLKSVKVSKIYSSPLMRAKETADIIGEAIKKEVIILENLKEMPLYDCNIEENFYLKEHISEFLEFEKNAWETFTTLSNEKEDIIVIGHGTWIKSVLCKKNKVDFFDTEKYEVENGEIFEINF